MVRVRRMPEPSTRSSPEGLAQKDVWKAVRASDGSGAGAARYVNNVVQFTSYSGEVA